STNHSIFFLQCSADHRPLHSFPTRRSSDLGIIDSDLQSKLDPLFGTHASRAPGPVSLERDALDLRSDLSYEGWRWRLGIQKRKRSEEHTSELQSRSDLVCRLLLEKKKKKKK